MLWSKAPWAIARDSKQAEREAALLAGQALLDDAGSVVSAAHDLEILQATASEIVQNIGRRKAGWTATSVLLVYIRRSLLAQKASNVLTEVMYAQAFRRARALDEAFEKTGELVGPLHGVPCSLKDQLDVVGFDSTIGFTHECNKPAQTDAVLVQVLLRAGAVPFVKTNVPQTLLSFESQNPLFGASTNPYDSARTTGGSSGGEAGLIAADGCPLGIGSDIGGSLRIPAHYSGCYGLKPCAGRFPATGAANPNPGFEAINTSFGPMGRSVADLELVTRVVTDASIALSRTEALVPLAYRDVALPNKLRFGYYLTDTFCRASPACERAVMETVEALRKEGHECVEFTPPDPIKALELFAGLTSAGGYQTLLAGLKGDPQESSIWLTTTGPKLPWFVRDFLTAIIQHVLGDAIFVRVLRSSRMKSVTETQAWAHERDVYAAEFRTEVWGNLAFDAIICAPQAVPALKLGQTWDLSPLALGTFLYNVVDSTAGVIPVTFVDPAKDAVTDEWRQRGLQGCKTIEQRVFGSGGVYNAKEMAGLPVGVQVVGSIWEEEKVIELMKVVDKALGPRGFGPGEFAKRTMPM